jgi:hypothetical protein
MSILIDKNTKRICRGFTAWAAAGVALPVTLSRHTVSRKLCDRA